MKKCLGIFLTLTFWAFLAHDVAYLSHEYGHSTMAWILGHKDNPLALDYGDTSVMNVLLLSNVRENISYGAIGMAKQYWHMGLIAASGLVIGNGLGYVISRKIIYSQIKTGAGKSFPFFFWLNFMSILSFYSLIPKRTVTQQSDMFRIAYTSGISSWVLLVVLTPLVFWAIGDFFFRTLPKSYGCLHLRHRGSVILMVICAALMFCGYMIENGLFDKRFGEVSYYITLGQTVLFPITLYLCWPAKKPAAYAPVTAEAIVST